MAYPFMKSFNIESACRPNEHYMLPIFDRCPKINEMIDGKKYFLIHSPRQSGKTTVLKNLTNQINKDGKYYAVWCPLSRLTKISDDADAMNGVVSAIRTGLKTSSIPILKQKYSEYQYVSTLSEREKVDEFLYRLTTELDKETILFFDEMDTLTGSPLYLFLSILKDFFDSRTSDPIMYPRSIALVGTKDIREALDKIIPENELTGRPSPFNISPFSLTLPNFNIDEVEKLYAQHTQACDQIFERNAIERAWHWSEGQPWLVNALANEVIANQLNNDFSQNITGENIDKAAYTLISSKLSHIQSLKNRFAEKRISKVLFALFGGTKDLSEAVTSDDIQIVVDLGLVKMVQDNISGESAFHVSNPIYQSVIVKALTSPLQNAIPDEIVKPYINSTSIDMKGLIASFQTYWQQNSGMFTSSDFINKTINLSVRNAWKSLGIIRDNIMSKEFIKAFKKNFINATNESLAHLVFFSFIQKLVNGGVDSVTREYALGNSRADICIIYNKRIYPIELKIKGVSTYKHSIEQLHGYMDKCGADEGWLLIIDKDLDKPWTDKIRNAVEPYKGKTIHVFYC
ncbi:MAG: AAA-like domain-containing protein [Deltaproteobacteria bacterium]|jgi:type II secretory pathway predicted ATPase ExeA|nr:AAA-like domain-containing protein [Deltaproteobacteria bacterium]